MNAQTIGAELEKSGYCICPDFLSAESLSETRQDLDDARAAGSFHRAGVGQGRSLDVHDAVRRDEICWLDRDGANAVQTRLWTRLDLLKNAFNSSPLYMGLSRFEGHYAAYPEGGYYKRHLDSVKKDNARVVSFILYLNRGWKSEDGGRLRIFDERETSGHYRDVDPVGGTMVCFMSGEFEHEVRTSHAERFSFSGWFKRSE